MTFTGFVTRVVEQELFTLPEHVSARNFVSTIYNTMYHIVWILQYEPLFSLMKMKLLLNIMIDYIAYYECATVVLSRMCDPSIHDCATNI